MSNSLSTFMQTQKRTPAAGPPSGGQAAFNQGTMGMLDDARQVVENAVGQGQELNPMIYQMLGLQPQYEDHSGDLQGAQSEMDAAQQQAAEAQKQIDQLKGIPPGKRTPDQRKQFQQLKKQLPVLQKSLGDAKNKFNQLQTAPKQITGFNRMDPNAIDKSSPFSAQNPLNQAQATEAQRLNQYLQGGEVDPTLKHQYDSAEQALRAQLTQRYGPDYANSSVGQMALQNFSRQKNEAFATWNQQQVDKYNTLAFQGQQNLQQLLAGQISLMREPSTNATNMGTQLSNLAQTRLQQAQGNLQERAAEKGQQINTSNFSPAGLIGSGASGLGQLLTTPYNSQGDTLGGAVTGSNAASQGSVNVPNYGDQSALTSWATGGGSAAGAGAGYDAAAATGEAVGGYTSAEGATALADL